MNGDREKSRNGERERDGERMDKHMNVLVYFPFICLTTSNANYQDFN